MSRNALNLNFIKLQYEDFTSCFVAVIHAYFVLLHNIKTHFQCDIRVL